MNSSTTIYSRIILPCKGPTDSSASEKRGRTERHLLYIEDLSMTEWRGKCDSDKFIISSPANAIYEVWWMPSFRQPYLPHLEAPSAAPSDRPLRPIHPSVGISAAISVATSTRLASPPPLRINESDKWSRWSASSWGGFRDARSRRSCIGWDVLLIFQERKITHRWWWCRAWMKGKQERPILLQRQLLLRYPLLVGSGPLLHPTIWCQENVIVILSGDISWFYYWKKNCYWR